MGNVADLRGNFRRVETMNGVTRAYNFTPLQLLMLLHYSFAVEPYSKDNRIHATSPAVTTQRAELIKMELLMTDDTRESGYVLTERGRVLIEALQATPLPVQRWSMP